MIKNLLEKKFFLGIIKLEKLKDRASLLSAFGGKIVLPLITVIRNQITRINSR
jgi:hypothetical protein